MTKDGTAANRVPVNVPYERFLDCVHCGLCIDSCPTYVVTGNEADSPRGRIHLMRALADGRIGFTKGVKHHLDLCLGCLACETACPSGVRYHEIIEAGRELSREHSGISLRQRAMERTLYDPDALELAVQPLRWAARFGLEKQVRAAAGRLPAGLGEMVALLPELPPARLRKQVPELLQPVGERRARVGFLTGCVMSVFFTPTNLSTLRVLANNGCEVHIPKGQGCCGALAVHSGDKDGGKVMAKALIDRFGDLDLDAIIVNAAGCGSMMKEYGHLLADDDAYAERARTFASLVKDASEFLAALPIGFPAAAPPAADEAPLRVTYHDACHLAHGQKIRKPPRALLEQMPGITLVELPEADWCCGSAGTYNLTQPEMAERQQRRKVENILKTGADVVVMGNPGCQLQIENGLRQAGSSIRVMHTMDLLATAYPAHVPLLPDVASARPEAPRAGNAERGDGL